MKNYPLIKNPLTVIAIFASLTEIVCGAVTPSVSDVTNQKLFLIFVISFPILLVILFFLTLNFNHKVLYAPSDFNETDNNIAELFYGKEKEQAIIELPSKSLKKHNSFNTLDISEIGEESKPYFVFAKHFYETIEKLLPIEKKEEINFDSKNNTVYTLEIRIKPDYIKDDERTRDIFVLFVKHSTTYNTEIDGNQKKSYGFIAGAGLAIHNNNYEELAYFVVSIITNRLKNHLTK